MNEVNCLSQVNLSSTNIPKDNEGNDNDNVNKNNDSNHDDDDDDDHCDDDEDSINDVEALIKSDDSFLAVDRRLHQKLKSYKNKLNLNSMLDDDETQQSIGGGFKILYIDKLAEMEAYKEAVKKSKIKEGPEEVVEKFTQQAAESELELEGVMGAKQDIDSVRDYVMEIELNDSEIDSASESASNDRGDVSLSRGNTTLSRENTTLSRGNTTLSRENTTLSRGNTTLSRENTTLSCENTTLSCENTELSRKEISPQQGTYHKRHHRNHPADYEGNIKEGLSATYCKIELIDPRLDQKNPPEFNSRSADETGKRGEDRARGKEGRFSYRTYGCHDLSYLGDDNDDGVDVLCEDDEEFDDSLVDLDDFDGDVLTGPEQLKRRGQFKCLRFDIHTKSVEDNYQLIKQQYENFEPHGYNNDNDNNGDRNNDNENNNNSNSNANDNDKNNSDVNNNKQSTKSPSQIYKENQYDKFDYDFAYVHASNRVSSLNETSGFNKSELYGNNFTERDLVINELDNTFSQQDSYKQDTNNPSLCTSSSLDNYEFEYSAPTQQTHHITEPTKETTRLVPYPQSTGYSPHDDFVTTSPYNPYCAADAQLDLTRFNEKRATSYTTNNISSSVNTNLVPNRNVHTFNGDVSQWSGFIEAFEFEIDGNEDLSNSEKMEYLESNLSGEAKRFITNFNLCKENYGMALHILKDRYGRKQE